MRTLPKNISAHPDGWLVRVMRKGICYQAFVSRSRVDALAEAIRLRDRFITIHGAIAGRGPSKRALSNTGIVGISETIHWRRSRPLDCFLVSAAPNFRRRIYFGEHRPREVALRLAVELRRKMIHRGDAEARRN